MRIRIVPDGLAGRFALVLSAALVAASVIAMVLLVVTQRNFNRDIAETREIERIVALVPALEAVAPDVRDRVARDASTRFARVQVETAPQVASTAADVRSRVLAGRISTALAGRDVAVVIRSRSGGPDGRGDWRGRDMILVSIPLNDGAGARGVWLNIATTGAPPARGVPGGVVLITLALSLVCVLAVALVFARRLTRPLAALAAAAGVAGRGDRTARVPEAGAREVRTAAAAFNAMQAEIARFDAERLRTLAAVGHDLRTPMTSLRIRAEMVDDDALRTPMIRTLDEMAALADGLVAYAREGWDTEAVEAVDLTALLSHLCDARGATFVQGPRVMFDGRPVGLGRMFGNLVDNALRYGGFAAVDLTAGRTDVTVTVDDTGPGIPADRLSAMFDPFARGDDSRSTDTGGAGLGLSIARSVAVAHGGSVTLANRPGGGLRATVVLPI